MLFCQLGRAHSLREICGGLACCEGQLKHLGVPVAPKRSTLAYANEKRPWELYRTVFELVSNRFLQFRTVSEGPRKVGEKKAGYQPRSEGQYHRDHRITPDTVNTLCDGIFDRKSTSLQKPFSRHFAVLDAITNCSFCFIRALSQPLHGFYRREFSRGFYHRMILSYETSANGCPISNELLLRLASCRGVAELPNCGQFVPSCEHFLKLDDVPHDGNSCFIEGAGCKVTGRRNALLVFRKAGRTADIPQRLHGSASSRKGTGRSLWQGQR